jgi:hypothetical protein
MELKKNVGDRSQLARTVLTIALTLVAVRSLRKGKRVTGVLAGAGAVALGYSATTKPGKITEGIDTTNEEAKLYCAVCGKPIRPGQRRSPNEDNQVVHDDCRVSVE